MCAAAEECSAHLCIYYVASNVKGDKNKIRRRIENVSQANVDSITFHSIGNCYSAANGFVAHQR